MFCSCFSSGMASQSTSTASLFSVVIIYYLKSFLFAFRMACQKKKKTTLLPTNKISIDNTAIQQYNDTAMHQWNNNTIQQYNNTTI